MTYLNEIKHVYFIFSILIYIKLVGIVSNFQIIRCYFVGLYKKKDMQQIKNGMSCPSREGFPYNKLS